MPQIGLPISKANEQVFMQVRRRCLFTIVTVALITNGAKENYDNTIHLSHLQYFKPSAI